MIDRQEPSRRSVDYRQNNENRVAQLFFLIVLSVSTFFLNMFIFLT